MRRRRNLPVEVPAALVVFEGFRYRTAQAWVAAFADFRAAREALVQEGAVLAPYEVNGSCPFDYSRFRKSEVRETVSGG